MLKRRDLLTGSIWLSGATLVPGRSGATCVADPGRWPAPGELVDGNDPQLMLATARALMEKVGHAALGTMDEGGLPRVRSMGTSTPEDDMTVWMMTKAVSRKVGQIRARPEVALHYVDIETVAEVTLMGMATVHDDPETLHAKNFFTQELIDEWWPGFPDGHVMISLQPRWLEISAPGTGIKGDLERWRPAGLVFRE